MTPKVVFASAALVLCLGFAAPASAAAFVLGGGLADACSRFAVQGRSDDYSLSTCTYALETENLVKRDRAATLVNRGVIQLRRKAYAQANRDFDTAIRLQPSMGEAFVNRGAALLGQRRWGEGKAEIDKGLALGADGHDTEGQCDLLRRARAAAHCRLTSKRDERGGRVRDQASGLACSTRGDTGERRADPLRGCSVALDSVGAREAHERLRRAGSHAHGLALLGARNLAQGLCGPPRCHGVAPDVLKAR